MHDLLVRLREAGEAVKEEETKEEEAKEDELLDIAKDAVAQLRKHPQGSVAYAEALTVMHEAIAEHARLLEEWAAGWAAKKAVGTPAALPDGKEDELDR